MQARAALATAAADYPADSTAAHVLAAKIALCSAAIGKATGGQP